MILMAHGKDLVGGATWKAKKPVGSSFSVVRFVTFESEERYQVRSSKSDRSGSCARYAYNDLMTSTMWLLDQVPCSITGALITRAKANGH